MPRKFETKNADKCEAVRQAMPRVRRVGSERMSWATYGNEVSRLAGFNNPSAVKNYIQRHAMSLKPAWVDDPLEQHGARGPFGISGALRDLSVENCVLVEGDVAYSCLGKRCIDLPNGDTARSRRFQASDYDSIEEAKEAALKHTQHVAAFTSYYYDDPMAKKIREPPKEDGSGGRGYVEKTQQRDGHYAGDDGVFTDPRTGRIHTNDAQGRNVYHPNEASARRAADAQPQRIVRRLREQNTQVFMRTGDASQLPYDPRAGRKLAEAQYLYGPNAYVDAEGKVVVPDESEQSDASGQSGTPQEKLKWAQCDRCGTWRRLPPHVDVDRLPERWFCEMNIWDAARARCDAPEPGASTTEAPPLLEAAPAPPRRGRAAPASSSSDGDDDEDLVGPPAPTPAQPRRGRAAASRGQEEEDDDEDLPAAPAPARRRGGRRRGARAPRGGRRTPGPPPTWAWREPKPPPPPPVPRAITQMNARVNESLKRHLPEAELAMCPAHVHQHLGLFDDYLPVLEQFLSQARLAAQTYVGGQWIVDDEKVLKGVYKSLVSERRLLTDAFTRIYGVAFSDDAQYSRVARMHRVVAVGLTTGYTASSLALALLPIAELLYDKAYFNADKLYFSRYGARVAVTDLSSRAQNFAARDVAASVIRHRLGQGDGGVVGGVDDAMEEDADDVRRHLKRLRGELAALDQQREAIAAHIERLVAQFGDAEIEGE